MTDAAWTDEDDAWFRAETRPDDHPTHVARVFFLAVRDESLSADILGRLVTPESRADWGDFSKARSDFLQLRSPGISTVAKTALLASDVAYVLVLEDAGDSPFVVTQAEVVSSSHVFTLVWRPEAGLWQVHRFGDYALPEALPRSSPGNAPTI